MTVIESGPASIYDPGTAFTIPLSELRDSVAPTPTLPIMVRLVLFSLNPSNPIFNDLNLLLKYFAILI